MVTRYQCFRWTFCIFSCSETFICTYKLTCRYKPKDQHGHIIDCKNLKSRLKTAKYISISATTPHSQRILSNSNAYTCFTQPSHINTGNLSKLRNKEKTVGFIGYRTWYTPCVSLLQYVGAAKTHVTHTHTHIHTTGLQCEVILASCRWLKIQQQMLVRSLRLSKRILHFSTWCSSQTRNYISTISALWQPKPFPPFSPSEMCIKTGVDVGIEGMWSAAEYWVLGSNSLNASDGIHTLKRGSPICRFTQPEVWNLLTCYIVLN
jgi:hypothetical protein